MDKAPALPAATQSLSLSLGERVSSGFSRLTRLAAGLGRSASSPSQSLAVLTKLDPSALAEAALSPEPGSRELAWLAALRQARDGDESALLWALRSDALFSLPAQNPDPRLDEALISPGRDLLKLIVSGALSQESLSALAQARVCVEADDQTSLASFAALCRLHSPLAALRVPQGRRNALRAFEPVGIFGALRPFCALALANAANLSELALGGVFDHPFWRRNLSHSRSLSQDAPTGACSFIALALRSRSEEELELTPQAARNAALIFRRAAERSVEEMSWMEGALAASLISAPERECPALIIAPILFELPPPKLAKRPAFARAFELRELESSAARAPGPSARRRSL